MGSKGFRAPGNLIEITALFDSIDAVNTLSCIGFAILSAVLPASAVTVVNDGFEVGTHPTGFRTVVTPGSGGVAYYGSSGLPAISLGMDAGMGSNALLVTPTANHQVVAPLGGSINLNSVGDFANLSFRIRSLNTSASEVGAFRFGLHGSNTPATGDNFTTVTDDDFGYYAILGYVSSNAGTAAGSAFLYEEGIGTLATPILGGGDRVGLVATTAGAGPLIASGNTAVHTVNFRLDRTASGVQISYSFDGGTTFSATDTATLRTSFSQISLSNGFTSTFSQYAIDDLLLEASNFTPIPEPTVAGLAGLGLLALLKRRRA